MFPNDVANYVSEIARVLKPGGFALNTFFLDSPHSQALVRDGKALLSIHHQMDGFKTVDPQLPESAIALPETFVRELHEKYGLRITEIKLGSWCGYEQPLSYQDIIVAQRTN